MRLLWQLRIKFVYPAAAMTQHALSVDKFRQMGADKSYADLYDLMLRVLRRAASLNNQAIQILLLLAAILSLYVVWQRGSTGKWQLRVPLYLLTWCALVYTAYLIALWGMYSFTLPLRSARELVAFERYNSTCALFLYGCTCAAVFVLTDRVRATLRTVLAAVLLVTILIPSWTVSIPRLIRESYFVPMRAQMEEVAQKRPLGAEETAVVIVDQTENLTLAHYMARYVFWNDTVTISHSATDKKTDVVYVLNNVPVQIDAETVYFEEGDK